MTISWSPPRAPVFRLGSWLIAGASRLVPLRRRAEWSDEWRAELWYRVTSLLEQGELGPREQLRLLYRCLGAFRHALWVLGTELTGTRLRAAVSCAAEDLRARPGRNLAAIAVAGLALGAGGLAFTVALGVRAAASPYPGDGRTVRIFNRAPAADLERAPLSGYELNRFRTHSRSFESLAGFRRSLFQVEVSGAERQVRGARVTPDWFRAAGVEPSPLDSALSFETAGDRGAVAVVREDLWLEWPGAAPRSLTVDGKPYRIVGTVPGWFHFPSPEAKIWIPLRLADFSSRVGDRAIGAIGRLGPGVSVAEAQADLARVSSAIQAEHPEGYLEVFGVRWGIEVVPVDAVPSDQLPLLALLLSAAGLLVIGGSAAVALLAVRSEGRSSSPASAAIAATGTLAAAGLLAAGLYSVGSASGTWIQSNVTDLIRNAGGFLAASGALVFALRQLGPSRRRESALVATSVALVILLAGGLMTIGGAYHHKTKTAVGYDPAGLVALRSLRGPLDPALADRVVHVSGINGATLASTDPGFELTPSTTFELDGSPHNAGPPPGADVLTVGDRYFEVMGIPLVAGHDFTSEAQAPEVIVNRTLAERFWPRGGALGRRMLVHGSGGVPTSWLTIVGIAADVRRQGITARPVSEIYLPSTVGQHPLSALLIRSGLRPDDVLPALQREGAVSAGMLAVPTELEAVTRSALAPYRQGSRLLAVVALVAGLVAMVAAGMARRSAAIEGLCLGGLVGGVAVVVGARFWAGLSGGQSPWPIELGVAVAGLAMLSLLPAALVRR